MEAGGERWRRSGGYAGGSKSKYLWRVQSSQEREAIVDEWRLRESDGEDLDIEGSN